MKFAISTDGIYFIPPPSLKTPRDYTIEFLRFASGKIETFARLEKPPFIGMAGSPDGRWLLYTQTDQAGCDLMLVENLQ